MPNLSDPRCFAAGENNPLQDLAARIVAEPDAMQRERFRRELLADLKQSLCAGRDDLLSRAVTEVASPAAGRCLWSAVDQAVNTPADENATLVASLFAIPVVFVAASAEDREVSGTLKDVRRLARVLEEHGALGVNQNFGLNQALCADTSVEAFSLSRLYALLRRVEAERVDIWPDLIPAEIQLDPGEERVDLRFVAGIAVTGVNAPSFSSTAADIGRWGMPFASELIAQLGQRGVSLLPIPRPPSPLLQALHRGHSAREEVAFQTFISRVLKEFRGSFGEPEVTLSAVRPDAILIRVTAQVQRERVEMHRRLLHPLDEFSAVANSIFELLAACRVDRIAVLEEVADDSADLTRIHPPPH